jgi:hypothetical protein
MEKTQISTLCGDCDLLFDELFMEEVNYFFKDSKERLVYIDTETEPFKSISLECEKFIAVNTIKWGDWYIVKPGKEHLFRRLHLSPLQEAVKRVLVDRFDEEYCIDIICETIIFDNGDFEGLSTIADLDDLVEQYSMRINNEYSSIMNDLTDVLKEKNNPNAIV